MSSARHVPRALFTIASFLVACGPGTPEPVVIAKPPPPPPKTVVIEPRGARYFIAPHAAAMVRAELAVGTDRMLVGDGGQRFLVSGSSVKNAETLVPEAIRDVARSSDGRFLFLGESGSAYLATDPLGPIETRRPIAGLVRPIGVTAGKRALFVLDNLGAVRRSTDDGITWSMASITWPTGAHPQSIVATRKGEVMVLAFPQRVMVSTDDGETFQPLATPSIGAVRLARSADDVAVLEGRAQWAALRTNPTRLEVVAKPALPALPTDGSAGGELLDRLVGDRHVTFESRVNGTMRTFEVGVAPLGKSAPRKTIAQFVDHDWHSVQFAGGGEFVAIRYLFTTPDGLRTRVLRTHDDGATWETIDFDGAPSVTYFQDIYAGPAGELLLDGYCLGKPGKNAKSCGTHVYTKGAWRKLGGPDERFSGVWWDSPRSRVYWIAASDGRIYVGKSDFTDARVIGSATGNGLESANIDANGLLRGIDHGHARTFPLDDTPGLDIPLPFSDVEVSIVGKRGLAIGRVMRQAFETDDGGEHWSKVTAPNRERPQCAAAGCVIGGVDRVGWELPSSAFAVVTEKVPLDVPPDVPEPEPSTSTLPNKTLLRCKTAGAWKRVPGYYQVGDAPIAWLATETYPAHAVTWAKGSTISRAVLFDDPNKATKGSKESAPVAADATSLTVRTLWSDAERGMVVGRYGFEFAEKGSGKKNPVDVELAWIEFSVGKVNRVKIPNVAPFRVSSAFASAGFAVLADHRLAFLPAGTAPLYLIEPSGKLETWTRPPTFADYDFTRAYWDGKKLVLARADRDFLIAESTDGKTWTERIWTIGGDNTFGKAGGKPFVRTGRFNVLPDAMFPVEGLPLDPPTALALPPLQREITACTPPRLSDLELQDNVEGPSLDLTFDGKSKTFVVDTAHRRVGPGHGGCVAALKWRTEGSTETAITLPHDPTHGWLFREITGGTEARPITCAAPAQ